MKKSKRSVPTGTHLEAGQMRNLINKLSTLETVDLASVLWSLVFVCDDRRTALDGNASDRAGLERELWHRMGQNITSAASNANRLNTLG